MDRRTQVKNAAMTGALTADGEFASEAAAQEPAGWAPADRVSALMPGKVARKGRGGDGKTWV
jgi:hypothetical protein